MAQDASLKEPKQLCLWENNVMPVEQQLLPNEENDILAFSKDELDLNNTYVINTASRIRWCDESKKHPFSPTITICYSHRRGALHTSTYCGRSGSMNGRVGSAQSFGPSDVPARLWINWGA
jgi:hypothetical protein